jgi:hypothetical protein
MGLMEVSAPRLNRLMPTISMAPPIKKLKNISAGTGKNVTSKKSTIPVTGNTDFRDSDIFSDNTVLSKNRMLSSSLFHDVSITHSPEKSKGNFAKLPVPPLDTATFFMI